jgi:hypothetical protein
MKGPAMYGVYRVLRSGEHRYVSRSVTHSQKLAEEIARDLTDGRVVMPDGSTKRVPAYPHIAKAVV